MKVIKCDLPSYLKEVEIHTFADEHIGDANCDIDRLKKRIEYVANTPNAYCIMNGDIMDNATRSSIGDVETRELNIMAQLERAVELFSPIKDKILAITNGNHEARTYRKEGVDMSRLIASQLGIVDKYSPTSAFLFIRLGENTRGQKETNGSGKLRKICYTLYMLHGSGGGRKEGAKAIRLADMASIIDSDIFCHAHTHLPMVMKQSYFRVDKRNNTVRNVERLFVNNASNLHYGGYGEMQEYKPNSLTSPIIYLNGTKKEFSARL